MNCKDCGATADPDCTIVAAEYGHPGEPDIYFCRRCREQANKLLQLIERGINSGKVTVKQVGVAIAGKLPN